MKTQPDQPFGFLKVAAAALQIIFILGIASCSNAAQKTQWSIDLSCFPEDSPSYTLKIVQFAENGDKYEKCSETDLGQVTPSSTVQKTIDIEPTAVEVGIFLLDSSGSPYYFYSVLVSRITDGKATLRYWLDYDTYFNSDRMEFGLNRAYIRTMPENTTLELDYSDAPIYMYQMSGVLDKELEITAIDKKGSSYFYFSASFADMMKYTTLTLGSKNGDTWFYRSRQNDFLMRVKPVDYSEPSICLLSANRFESFPFVNVFSPDNGYLYFDADSDNNSYSTYQVLKKWEVANGTVTNLSNFTSAITASARDGQTIYLGVDSKLYTFDIASGNFTHVQNVPATISAICPVGSNLIVYYSSGYSSAGAKLISKTDFSMSPEKKPVNVPGSFVYFPDKNYMYFIRSNDTNHVYCQVIDPVAKTLGTEMSTYTSDYSFKVPLKQFGSEPKLITGSGHILTTDSPENYKVAYSGSFGGTFDDILFESDCILTLQNGSDGFYIVKNSYASPYAEITRSQKFTGEEGERLFRTTSGLVVVSTSIHGNGIRVRNISASDLTTRSIGEQFGSGEASQYRALSERRLPAYR